MPVSLVGSAIAAVFMPNAIEAVREDRLRYSAFVLERQLAGTAFPTGTALFCRWSRGAPRRPREKLGGAANMVNWISGILRLQIIANLLARNLTILQN